MRKIVVIIAMCLIIIAISTSCTQSVSLNSDQNRMSKSDTQISTESSTQTLQSSETTTETSKSETSFITTTSSVTTISETETSTSVSLTTTLSVTSMTTSPVSTTTTVPTTVTVPTTTAVAVTTTVPVTTTSAITTVKTEVKLITPEKLKPLADEIFRLTNEERKKAGVSELKSYILLSNAAQIRADECSKNKTLEHKRPDGRPCDTVLDELNLKSKCSWWGENAAYCSTEPTAEFIVGKWMGSQGHKNNMLLSRYTHVGIGVSVADNGAYYFIQVFAEQKKNTDWQ